jgi:small subunit ribosomal protein S20
MAEEEKNKKKKMPTASKRIVQSKKIHKRARAFKSKIRTAITSIEKAMTAKEAKDSIQKKLNALNSLMDKGAKKGICKKNKAARIKSRFIKKVTKG